VWWIRREMVMLVAVLLAALSLRAAVLGALSENLSDDRDAYRGIAESLVEGTGFSHPGTTAETAYRPPLYPLLVAAIFKAGGGDVALAATHAWLGTLTVLLTYLIGRRLGLGRAAFSAAVLVAVDPLLLQYMSFPMTETVFTFLATLLLAMLVDSETTRCFHKGAGGDRQPGDPSHAIVPWAQGRLWWAGIGVVFGLCALCRPTIWAFGVFIAAAWIVRSLRDQQVLRAQVASIWPAVLALAVVVAPWLIRNAIVFRRPILTTTHGGYTLLLGNNPVFYNEVVMRPWGTTWDDAEPDRTQSAWLKDLKLEMQRELPAGAADEPGRDRWMSRRAWGNIANEPSLFAKSCWLRFRRFWNVVPLGTAAELVPAPVCKGIGLFYVVVSLGLILGLLRLTRKEWPRWMPLVLLMISFTLVHLFYWSNTRMRAPLVPAIAVLAGYGFSRWARGPCRALGSLRKIWHD